MTFSLLGRCDRTGRLGLVVASSSSAVAARCAHVRPRIGVAASQNVTDPRLGPLLLYELSGGRGPRAAIDAVVGGAPQIEHRQLLVLDARGEGAAYTGAAALGLHGHRIARDCVVGGNLLADESVLDAVAESFGTSPGFELGDRLVEALRAGASAGGEAGPVHSAGLVMTSEVQWPIADLRRLARGPDRAARRGLGRVPATAGRLRRARARSHRGTGVRRSRRVTAALPVRPDSGDDRRPRVLLSGVDLSWLVELAVVCPLYYWAARRFLGGQNVAVTPTLVDPSGTSVDVNV